MISLINRIKNDVKAQTLIIQSITWI